MKKYLISLFACVSAILLNGCDVYKTEVYEIGSEIFTDYITASAADWCVYGEPGVLGAYAYQDFKFSEIDPIVMESGMVSVYFCSVEKEGDVTVDRDHPLPYVFTVKNDLNKDITQNIRFAVENGYLRIIVEWSDARIYMQGDCQFKVCILRPGQDSKQKR